MCSLVNLALTCNEFLGVGLGSNQRLKLLNTFQRSIPVRDLIIMQVSNKYVSYGMVLG